MLDPRIISLIMELRKMGITDQRVLSAIERVPRAEFLAAPFRAKAWDNCVLPIACGQTISQPYIVAKATEALEVHEDMRVLEIGTGCGYQAAVLSLLCRRVYTIERHKPLMKEAAARLSALGAENIVTWHDDGFRGWPEQAPFDRILLSCAVEEVPQSLLEQLKPGGILVAPVGPSRPGTDTVNYQHLTKIIRGESGAKAERLIPVLFVPMLKGLP